MGRIIAVANQRAVLVNPLPQLIYLHVLQKKEKRY